MNVQMKVTLSAEVAIIEGEFKMIKSVALKYFNANVIHPKTATSCLQLHKLLFRMEAERSEVVDYVHNLTTDELNLLVLALTDYQEGGANTPMYMGKWLSRVVKNMKEHQPKLTNAISFLNINL